jgi:hypothetical protein
VTRNKYELERDGLYVEKIAKVINLLSLHIEGLKNYRGITVTILENEDEISIPSRVLRLFTRRAIHRVGILLRNSKIANWG